jgi:hypothetical protein
MLQLWYLSRSGLQLPFSFMMHSCIFSLYFNGAVLKLPLSLMVQFCNSMYLLRFRIARYLVRFRA